MQNFVFHNATKIIFGKGTTECVGREVAQYSSRILLVHYGDRFLRDSGLLDCVTDSLRASHVEFTELTGIRPNPTLSAVREGIAVCREKDIHFVLAIGGGSVIDTAKAIAAGIYYEGDVWNLFLRKGTLGKVAPTGVIVTMPATGSESSTGAVITNEETGFKQDIMDVRLRPAFAILNPELTYTLPAYQTFCGVADIMSHVMERYFTCVPDVDLTDRLCEGTLKAVIRNARILLEDPKNYSARAEIMWAATVAHGDLLSTGREGDWACHAIGTELSAVYNSTHGATLTVITPAWMEYVYKFNLDRFVQFAMRVWNVEYDARYPERTALRGIENLKGFFRELGLPVSFDELGVKDSQLELLAKRATQNGAIGCMKKLDQQDVLNILKLARSS